MPSSRTNLRKSLLEGKIQEQKKNGLAKRDRPYTGGALHGATTPTGDQEDIERGTLDCGQKRGSKRPARTHRGRRISIKVDPGRRVYLPRCTGGVKGAKRQSHFLRQY